MNSVHTGPKKTDSGASRSPQFYSQPEIHEHESYNLMPCYTLDSSGLSWASLSSSWPPLVPLTILSERPFEALRPRPRPQAPPESPRARAWPGPRHDAPRADALAPRQHNPACPPEPSGSTSAELNPDSGASESRSPQCQICPMGIKERIPSGPGTGLLGNEFFSLVTDWCLLKNIGRQAYVPGPRPGH
jgi:hypothetical protein